MSAAPKIKHDYLSGETKPSGPEHVENSYRRQSVDDNYIVDDSLVRVEGEDKVTPYLIFLIVGAALAGFLFGYDTGVVGGALPLIGDDLGETLTASKQEIITAATTLGAIVGCSVLGSIADRIGRKWCLFIADVFFTVGAVIIASSYSVPQIIVGRLVLGVGVGGAAVISPLYIAEVAPTAVRGRCLGTNAFFIPLGQVISSALSAALQHVPNAWRILFALGVVPSILQLLIFHWLPESPRIMILRGREEDAKKTLAQIYSKATPEMIELKLRVTRSYVEATTQLQRGFTFWGRMKRIWTHKPYRRAVTTVCGVMLFQQLTGYNTLLYYSNTFFSLLGLKNSAAAGLIPSTVNAFFLLIGMIVVDKVGRRRLMLLGGPPMIIGLVWAIPVAWYMTKDTNHRFISGADYDTTLAGALVGAITLFVAGYGFSLSHLGWYMSEFLALEIRATGSAMATGCVWVSNLVVSVSFLSELENITPSGTWALYLSLTLIGYIFVCFCYPESKGISIDEIGKLYETGWGVQESKKLRAEKRAALQRIHDAEARPVSTSGIDNSAEGSIQHLDLDTK